MPVYRINNRNILFIHVPKTGGTTIETCLARISNPSLHSKGAKLLKPVRKGRSSALPMQHFHAQLLEAMFAPRFFDYAFMIVRDPVERLKSEYRYARALGRPSSFLSCDAWLTVELELAKLDPYRRSNHFRPQSEFHCFDAEVFRFEDGFAGILDRLGNRLGVALGNDIPHERRSRDLAVGIKPASVNRIHRFYAEDYRRFGQFWVNRP